MRIIAAWSMLFLSTPSARRATLHKVAVHGLVDISIHALREEGDLGPMLDEMPMAISIHALREEGDKSFPTRFCLSTNFYPRPPRGGRPGSRPRCRGCGNFYPRPPRGGRPIRRRCAATRPRFLSTPSARRATVPVRVRRGIVAVISIHALREEGDSTQPPYYNKVYKFLSTPSARRATIIYSPPHLLALFLSTPSARRATRLFDGFS